MINWKITFIELQPAPMYNVWSDRRSTSRRRQKSRSRKNCARTKTQASGSGSWQATATTVVMSFSAPHRWVRLVVMLIDQRPNAELKSIKFKVIPSQSNLICIEVINDNQLNNDAESISLSKCHLTWALLNFRVFKPFVALPVCFLISKSRHATGKTQ